MKKEMKCYNCDNNLKNVDFINFYDYRGNFFNISSFGIRNSNISLIERRYTKFDLIICNHCFIYRRYYPYNSMIEIPDYIPVEQHLMWLKSHLFNS